MARSKSISYGGKSARAMVRASLLLAASCAYFVACSDDDDADDDEDRGGSGGASAGRAGSAGRNATGGSEAGTSSGDAGAGGGGELPDPCRGLALPEDQHYVDDGLCVRAVALDQGRLRQITFASNGDLIGVRITGEIVRYRDVDDDGMFEGDDEIVEIADTGETGNNAHIDEAEGFLYAGTPDGVRRWRYAADQDDLGEGEDIVTGQPSTGTHPHHTVHVYDGWLYVHSGSENNAVAPASPEYDMDRSVLKRFDLSTFRVGTPFDWSSGEVFVIGIRNMVGFTRNAEGDMYGVVNGMDNLLYDGADVHVDNPGEDLIRLEQGDAHGYPYCFTASHIVVDDTPIPAGTQLAGATDPDDPDPDFTNPHDDEWCAENSMPPVTFLTPHSAPLDITFFDDAPSGALPEEWRGGAFVALHGSWNTMPSVGHSVVFIPFDSDGEAPMPEATMDGTIFPYIVVFGGGTSEEHADGTWGWSSEGAGEDPVRPVGVAISPIDGALYVSSDNGKVLNTEQDPPHQGILYRIGIQR